MQQPGPRSKAREFAFKFIYQFQLPELKKCIDDDTSEMLDKKLNEFHESYAEKDSEHPDNSLNSEAREFGQSLIKETLSNWSKLEEIVASNAKGWKIDRMDKVDLSILMICACEMKTLKQTPVPVIINEGINLAKKFGATTSSSFINGVLDALSKVD